MIRIALFKNTLKQGLIMGFSFCIYTTLMWITKLDTAYLSIGQYLDMAIIILPIACIFWAIRQENIVYQVTIVERFAIAIFIGAISYLIYDPFLSVYHSHINPEWFASVLKLKETELKAANISEDKIMDTLQKLKDANGRQSGVFRLSTFVPSVVVLPAVIALISFIFIRGKAKR